MYLRRPVLSPETAVMQTGGTFAFSWLTFSLELKFADALIAEAVSKMLLVMRSQSLPLELLYDAADGLTSEQVAIILDQLDQHHMLVEGDVAGETPRSGTAVIVRLEREHAAWLAQERPGRLEKDFFDGVLPRQVLTGNAFEYYHLTSLAYGAIIPAFNRSHGVGQARMLDFILDEYRHDRIMLKAILALGYSVEEVSNTIPHPYTSGLMDLLGYWALTDDLAFKAALFIFEGQPTDSDRYLNALAKYDLPSGYYDSHAKHDHVNHDENHGAVSREFFGEIEHVSAEEEARVSAKLTSLRRMMRDRSDAIYDYYIAPDVSIPRTLHGASLSH